MSVRTKVAVIGAGLAGSEAALQLAWLRPSWDIDLIEMRPQILTPAHKTARAAELVCSNSFKSTDIHTPHGLAKEMLNGESFLFRAALSTRVPAGQSLAVDRELFSQTIEAELERFPNIRRRQECVDALPEGFNALIVATGPLTEPRLSAWFQTQMGSQALSFYDAIAPIVTKESLDLDKMYFGSRYDKGDPDFLNIPLSRDEYFQFVQRIRSAEMVPLADFEDVRYFENCLPIEVMVERGDRTLAFGPMKPVGLDDPRTGRRPFAVLQLRREDRFGSCFNMVGFQTKMKYGEQERVFRTLPGMANAEFVRLGSIHRNTYIHSPSQLHSTLQWRRKPRVFFAGQLTGAEGYTEAVVTGWVAARNAILMLEGKDLYGGDSREIFGALLEHITDAALHADGFQPMNFNFGLVNPENVPLEFRKSKSDRRKFLAERSLAIFRQSRILALSTGVTSGGRTSTPISEFKSISDSH
jgi:methylenetetrahydrofolate--tRNA-(uracil-5-)-methyltransferase